MPAYQQAVKLSLWRPLQVPEVIDDRSWCDRKLYPQSRSRSAWMTERNQRMDAHIYRNQSLRLPRDAQNRTVSPLKTFR